MEQQEEKDQQADSRGSGCFINEEHGSGGDQCSGKRTLPREEFEAGSEVGRRSYFEQEASEVHCEERQLQSD